MNENPWLKSVLKKLALRRKGADISDVPKQYKAAVDRGVIEVMRAARDLMVFSGELGGDVIELESENLTVKITRKKTKEKSQ